FVMTPSKRVSSAAANNPTLGPNRRRLQGLPERVLAPQPGLAGIAKHASRGVKPGSKLSLQKHLHPLRALGSWSGEQLRSRSAMTCAACAKTNPSISRSAAFIGWRILARSPSNCARCRSAAISAGRHRAPRRRLRTRVVAGEPAQVSRWRCGRLLPLLALFDAAPRPRLTFLEADFTGNHRGPKNA